MISAVPFETEMRKNRHEIKAGEEWCFYSTFPYEHRANIGLETKIFAEFSTHNVEARLFSKWPGKCV